MEFEPAILWPKYLGKPVERTLACFEGGLLLDEFEATWEPQSAEELVSLLFENNLQCYVRQVHTMDYIDGLKELATTSYATEDGKVIALTFANKRRSTRWIISSSSYGKRVPDREWLRLLRKDMDYAGVGTPNTAGAMGQALMKKAWRETYGEEWYLHRHQRPNRIQSRLLHDTRVGARSETTDFEATYEDSIQIDKKNAYAAASEELPTGPAFAIVYGQVEDMKMYYVRATVSIVETLPLGPFPLRRKNQDEENVYPTCPGDYDTWLWHNEIANSRKAGCIVKIHNGMGWLETTTDMACWVRLMEKLRDNAPTERCKDLMKLAIVAGLGRFGMSDLCYELISEAQRLAGDKDPSDRLAEGTMGMMTDWWVRATVDPRPQTMPHWYGWILACLRGWIYEEALPYAQSEHLVAIDTDAIYVAREADISQYKTEHVTTGDFRIKSYQRLQTPAKRHFEGIDADGKPYSKRPGKKR